MVCNGYSAVGEMEDFYSEGRGFEPASGSLPFVDMKISTQHNAACYSRAILATLYVPVCVWGVKNGNTIFLMRQLLKWDKVFACLRGHSNRMFRSSIVN